MSIASIIESIKSKFEEWAAANRESTPIVPRWDNRPRWDRRFDFLIREILTVVMKPSAASTASDAEEQRDLMAVRLAEANQEASKLQAKVDEVEGREAGLLAQIKVQKDAIATRDAQIGTYREALMQIAHTLGTSTTSTSELCRRVAELAERHRKAGHTLEAEVRAHNDTKAELSKAKGRLTVLERVAKDFRASLVKCGV